MNIEAIDINTGYRNLAAAIVESGIADADHYFLFSPWCAWLCEMLGIPLDATAITERLRTYYYRGGRWFCRRCGKGVLAGGRDVLTNRCSCWAWFK